MEIIYEVNNHGIYNLTLQMLNERNLSHMAGMKNLVLQ